MNNMIFFLSKNQLLVQFPGTLVCIYIQKKFHAVVWKDKGKKPASSKAEERAKMEEKLSSVAKRQTPSPIQQLSLLAQRCNAINLAEGFPDFPTPPHVKAAAVSAINSDFNQYRFYSTPQFSSELSLYLSIGK